MRRLIILTILFYLSIVGHVGSESQKPPPQSRESQMAPSEQATRTGDIKPILSSASETTRQRVGTDHRPTDCAPCTGTPRNKTIWEQTAEDPIALYTLWLALFTLVLAVSTIGLWITTFFAGKDTRKAANAAQKSAEALTTVERAYVFAKVEDIKIEPIDNTDFQTMTTSIFLQNHGKTPAIINNIRAVLTLEKPEIPIIEETTFPAGLILGSDKWHRINIDKRLNKAELDNVEAWNIPLFCCGRIKYSDVFSKEHETGFCWEYKPHKSRPLNPWIISANKELNYYK